MINPYTLIEPSSSSLLPVVFDSPHSSNYFPEYVKTLATMEQLLTGWDAFVEELWQGSVEQGAHLLFANFSRMFVDPNRSSTDIDPELLSEHYAKCEPTKYSERGMGLIRRFALPERPMYAKPLSIEEVESRIKYYHQPYHNALSSILDTLYQKFGGVWHIDCHSMKSRGNAMNIDSGIARPDIILGDNDGLCAESEFVQVIEDAFVKKGYSVVRNNPYKGGFLINHYSDRENNRHSMQIEINRALYMDESTFSRSNKFEHFQRDLSYVSMQITEYVRSRLA